MPIIAVQIPQIGEGLQEARLVAVLKQPGDRVRRDEPIYQMETDKAVMDVESPYDGILVEWLAPVDTILPIGGDVARMEVGEVVGEVAVVHGPSPMVSEVRATDEPNVIGVRIPQIGEGLQEARLVAVLKQPGEHIRRDEPIYQMETDKAVMDVESPYEGVLVEWLAPVDTVLAIGAEVARMRVSGPVQEMEVHGASAGEKTVSAAPAGTVEAATLSGGIRNANVSPRARAYAREKGVSDAQLMSWTAGGRRLTPGDIETLLAGSSASDAVSAPTTTSNSDFVEQAVGQKQRLLASRLVRSNQLVVPGTITVATNWEKIESLRAAYKASGRDFQPSAFTMFAFAVARALKDFPMFRSTLVGDSVLRTYNHANLGVAVALPGDELVIAVVEKADTLDWVGFANQSRARIALAREGRDQANEATTISLTNMQAFGLRDAVPVVAAPSVATLFLGEPYRGLAQDTNDLSVRRYVNLALTFDHRVINGVGASEFINAVKSNVENIDSLIPTP